MKFKPTEDQKRVIDNRGNSLLVAAAAGSGKTAVLVERILSLICDKSYSVDIDKFLIVTYTRAAAFEMKEKIYNAIYLRMEETKDEKVLLHLNRQIKLLPYAPISTIDSFCSRLLRENFNETGISPDFLVASEEELKLLEGKVLEEFFEELFENDDEEFIKLCDAFVYRNSIDRLKSMVLTLYNQSQSFPWPGEWLAQQKLPYQAKNPEDISNSKWYRDTMKTAKNRLIDIRKGYINLLGFIQENLDTEIPHPYNSCIQNDLSEIDYVLEDFDNRAFEIKLSPLSTKTSKGENKELRQEAKAKRDELKGEIEDIRELLIPDIKEYLSRIIFMCPTIEKLIDITIDFSERLLSKKTEENIFSFSDVEHFALEILRDKNTHEITDTAEKLRELYLHVMVDEYQDSNLLQEEILTSLIKSEGESNYFMVGDVKQSIYRFRKARPSLFTKKYNIFKAGANRALAVDLQKNFRSRNTVTDCVNNIFKNIMKQDIGGVEYDSRASLVFSAPYYSKDTLEHIPELLLASCDSPVFSCNHMDRDSIEAMLIGKRIRELIKDFTVTDKGGQRPVKYSDIVILHRSANKVCDKYIKILRKQGIPVNSAGMKGYFEKFEVEAIMDMLVCLNNPIDDIALTSILVNFYGFSNDDLTIFMDKSKGYAMSFFENQISCNNEKLSEACRQFNELRNNVQGKRLYEIIQMVRGIRYFKDKILTSPNRNAMEINIGKLLDLAVSFERTHIGGLHDFVKYIRGLKEYDVNLGDGLADEEDSVRIMTIHKSKGLEFPVCILAGLSKRRNPSRADYGMVISDTYGVGFDYIDRNLSIKVPMKHKAILSYYENVDNVAEEQRLLYVALTRAKEKLILTGCEKEDDIKERFNKAANIEYTYAYRLKAKNYLDLVMPIFLKCGYRVEEIAGDKLMEGNEAENADMAKREVYLQEIEDKRDNKLISKIREDISFKYPVSGGLRLKNKYSVSEIKRYRDIQDSEGEYFVQEREFKSRIPEFIQDSSKINLASRRGTAVHRFMECVEFSHNVDVEAELDRMVKAGFLTDIEGELIDINKIKEFFRSDLAREMIIANESNLLFKEKTFVCEKRAMELFPEEEFTPLEENDTVLIQGVIDAYYIHGDKAFIIDYKTDKVNNIEGFTGKYKVQLNMYAQALSCARGIKKYEKIIYSFDLGRKIII